ncbi:MAG: hypothetical protein EXX96DRAFT_545839 [Benjaminiella poitrasii]|nr:MAG: hypothetical protein EXX96DRAFT_545839 [Benjaminiella poitrasii]
MVSMVVHVRWISSSIGYQRNPTMPNGKATTANEFQKVITRKVAGIYHRLAKDVASKISTLQSNYRLAREWKEVDGKRLLETGVSEENIHEELLKRFPYWDALDEVFSSNKSTAWPMSISSIMHSAEEEEEENDLFRIKRENCDFNVTEPFTSPTKRRRRRLSDSTLQPNTRSSIDNSSDTASTTYSIQSLPTLQPPPTTLSSSSTPSIIRPLPQVLPSPILNSSIPLQHTSPPPPPIPNQPQSLLTSAFDRREQILADSLLQMAREKEAGRMKRSQEMLQFLREKRMERDQLLIEKEITKRVRAKADLVKNLIEAGFDKNAIAEQLSML